MAHVQPVKCKEKGLYTYKLDQKIISPCSSIVCHMLHLTAHTVIIKCAWHKLWPYSKIQTALNLCGYEDSSHLECYTVSIDEVISILKQS